MASLSAYMPPVRDYMSHFAAAKNDPFGSNYAAALAPYEIEMAAPTNSLVQVDISWQIYTANGDASTAFLPP